MIPSTATVAAAALANGIEARDIHVFDAGLYSYVADEIVPCARLM